MRKPYIAMMTILVLGLGSMLFAGNSLLSPLAQDAEKGKELTRYMAALGDIAPGSSVKVLRVRGSERRLVRKGRGLLVEMTPAPSVLGRPKGLAELSVKAARLSLQQSRSWPADWVEVAFDGVASPAGDRLRTVVRVSEEGALESPDPFPVAPSAPARP